MSAITMLGKAGLPVLTAAWAVSSAPLPSAPPECGNLLTEDEIIQWVNPSMFDPNWADFRRNRWAQLDSTVVSPMGFDLAQTCINFKARVDSVINSKPAQFVYRNFPYKYHLLRYGPYWVAVLWVEEDSRAWLMVFTKQTMQFLGDDMF